MPYADQNDYNRYQSCDCDNKDNCNCNDACGCCPIGTIEVKDECGNHVACLLPQDASQYYIDTLAVPEGYVKVFDSEGVFVGLLTVAQYIEWLAATGSSSTAGFNIIGVPVNQVTQNFTNTTPSSRASQQVVVDRFGVSGDITATLILAGVNGITMTGTSTKIDSLGAVITSGNNIIMQDTSLFSFTIDYSGASNTLGTYEGVIRFSGGGVDRYMKVTITIS